MYLICLIIIIIDILLVKNYTFNNVLIKDQDKTYQIDHIVISKYGIFVIETKFYYGYIIGDEYKEKWLRKKGKSKIYFHNPIYQNYGHIKALAKLLNISETNFVSIICFSHTTKLNIKAKNAIITKIASLNKNILKHQTEIIKDTEPIINTIKNNNIISHKELKKHIKQIHTITNNICPNCGHKLVKKRSKYGYFIGCSNYPNCHYIKKDK